VEASKANLEIIGEITWSWLVVDTGTGTRLILIPDAGVYLSIGRFGRWGCGTVRRWWDWITHDGCCLEETAKADFLYDERWGGAYVMFPRLS
jgi:hypothetical protein